MVEPTNQVARRIFCTFKGCYRYFPTERELIKHKKHTPEHDYCARCDEDFEDEESFFIHKLDSNRHIACPICGDEFKSEGGRDAHLRQIHPTDQALECVGCHTKFSRAHALMMHIEDDRCPGITKDQYKAQRAQKLATRVALEGKAGDSKGLSGAGRGAAAGSTIESVDGGVEITMDPSEFPPLGKGKAKVEALPHLAVGEGPDAFDDMVSEVSGVARSIKHWPMSFQQKNDSLKDLMAFSDIESTEKGQTEPASSEVGGIEEDWGDRPPELVESEKKMPQHFVIWDTKRYYNSVLGAYICPCDKVFKTGDELSKHLDSGIHDGGVVYCAGCLRPFNSTPALIAHIESVTSRCNIRHSGNLAQVVDEASGGVIETCGHYADGTAKFHAAPKQEIKPMDLDKIAW
uniref:C2H2-type domain-containing protein n=1 Tax=Coccidioides posadasii RMSCC 3488 TaxID=454284 RepID=A0A0J6IJN8_COCPO|nr:hypothetical protein CPAG_08406 [Coccidioides posadasii RMSCC 3488]